MNLQLISTPSDQNLKKFIQDQHLEELPDVLKNNFLEDPALSLVKSLDNINEIWKRFNNNIR